MADDVRLVTLGRIASLGKYKITTCNGKASEFVEDTIVVTATYKISKFNTSQIDFFSVLKVMGVGDNINYEIGELIFILETMEEVFPTLVCEKKIGFSEQKKNGTFGCEKREI